MSHPWLADLVAPVGSQEVVDRTHKWWQLIGQHLPVCRLGPQVSAGWVLSWQYYRTGTVTNCMVYLFFGQNIGTQPALPW